MNSNGQEIAREILEKVEVAVPFNSAYSYASQFLPAEKMPAIGGTCAHLTRELQSLLKGAGCSPETLVDRDSPGWHYATMCPIEGEVFYLDPSIYAEDPISTTQLFAAPVGYREYSSFHGASASRQLFAVVSGDGSFGVSRARYKDPFFSYDMSRSVVELPSAQAALQNSLRAKRQAFNVIGVFSRNDVVHLRYDIGQRAMALVGDASTLTSGTDFDKKLGRLSEKLGFTPPELTEVLSSSADVYNKVHGVRYGAAKR